jgi:hypothetical protein
MSLCVCSRNLVNKEALAHWAGGGGAVAPKTNNVSFKKFSIIMTKRHIHHTISGCLSVVSVVCCQVEASATS